MRARWSGWLLALLAVASLAPITTAKTFRYSSGPKPPADSSLSVTNPYLEPVVGTRGPRVPYTNLQMLSFVADSAAARALASAPLESGSHAVLAPAREHPFNFVVEHAMLSQLSRRGVAVTVRHAPVPDDSVNALYARPGDPLVEYTVGTAKVSYLRLVGWLPGRVKIERQALIEGNLQLRDPSSSRVVWTTDMAQSFADRFPRAQTSVVEDTHYPDLKSDPPGRNMEKVIEPIVVVAIVGGLVALFFQNRP
jgi:hypothetical protein